MPTTTTHVLLAMKTVLKTRAVGLYLVTTSDLPPIPPRSLRAFCEDDGGSPASRVRPTSHPA
eukprot:708134-Prymnesium_polylepis.1